MRPLYLAFENYRVSNDPVVRCIDNFAFIACSERPFAFFSVALRSLFICGLRLGIVFSSGRKSPVWVSFVMIIMALSALYNRQQYACLRDHKIGRQCDDLQTRRLTER